MALTTEQQVARKGKLTGSSIGVLMDGNEEDVLNLYYELTEDPRYIPNDTSGAWPPQLGSHTEIFSLHWYALKKGYGKLIKEAKTYTNDKGELVTEIVALYDNPLINLGKVITHPDHPWAAATLDAWDDVLKLPINCKHCGAHRKIPDVLSKYAPQAHWEMFVTGSRKHILRIILGANEAVDYNVEWDDFYWTTLWDRAVKFMEKVRSKSMGTSTEAPASPAPEAKAMVTAVFRTLDFKKMRDDGETMPNWATEMEEKLDTWLETVNAMKLNETATEEIKKLLPSDVGHLITDGVQIKRSKNGAVTIKKEEGKK